MTLPYVVGICGRAGSGKTLFGALLTARLVSDGWVVGQDAFAQPIKQWARNDLGYTGEKTPQMRWATQTHGSVLRSRALGHFIAKLDARWNSPDGCADVLIVSDVRYANEAEWVEEKGRVVVVKGRAADLGPNAGHESEQLDLASLIANPRTLLVDNDEACVLRELERQAAGVAQTIGDELRKKR